MANIQQVFEYLNPAGEGIIIATAGNAIYQNAIDFLDPNANITPTDTPTANHWQFFNFNQKVIGVQQNHGVIVYDGQGDFDNLQVNSGTAPVGGDCGIGAFGRVWILDGDEQTIRYSALLDETRWSDEDGGGFIDMSSVWTKGVDRVRAIAALGSNLVVFGENHIILWADDQGSSIGIDPTRMYVVDTIEGTGCVARDSVQAIGEGDLVYLSRHGLQSLGRVITQRVNPISALSVNVKTHLRDLVLAQTIPDPRLKEVRGCFYPEESFYLLHIPRTGKTMCFDTRQLLADDNGNSYMRVTEWELGGDVQCMVATRDGRLIFGADGVIGQYHGENDNGEPYEVSITTAWLELGEMNQRLKILKELSAIIRVTALSDFTYKWGWDFEAEFDEKDINYTGFDPSEYNVDEYTVAEYSGSLIVRHRAFPGKGSGQFVRVGLDTLVSGYSFILQQLQLVPAIGRLTV